MVKNHKKEGKWIEYKSNSFIDQQKYPEFTDLYTYWKQSIKMGYLPEHGSFTNCCKNIMKKQENLS
jgi:hypothetical protein